MITSLLLAMLWLLVILHITGAFLSFCQSMRYRDVSVYLDDERLGHQPFQPRVSVVVRGNLSATSQPILRIQELLSLNYFQYEVILLVDGEADPAAFERIISHFELAEVSDFQSVRELHLPIRACYRSGVPLYRRLTVIDREYLPRDDLRRTALAVARGGYMLFLASLDNELTCNGLTHLAVLKMREASHFISRIRGVGRFDCRGTFGQTFFRLMADLCNLRRIYITGPLHGADYGQYLILRDAAGRHGREEFVPAPQMYLHRPNRARTYWEQLAPATTFVSLSGRFVSWGEPLICITFWGAGIHIFATPGGGKSLLFLLAAWLLPTIAGVFSIAIGEILLKRRCDFRLIFRLLLLAPLEALVFCLLQPFAWAARMICKK